MIYICNISEPHINALHVKDFMLLTHMLGV